MFSLSSTLSLLLPLAASLPTSPAPVSAPFAISLVTPNYPRLSLNIDKSNVIGVYNLVFQRPTAYPGTPAYFNDIYLDFAVPDEENPYYMDIVDGEGVRDVLAIYGAGSGTNKFGLEGTKLVVTGEPADEGFLACNTTLFDGGSILGLKWGPNAVPVEGCVSAELVQNFVYGN